MLKKFRINKMYLDSLLVLIFIFFWGEIAMAQVAPGCVTSAANIPDPYSLGTGVNANGLCTAQLTAQAIIAAEAAAAIAAGQQQASLATQAEELAQNILTVQNMVIQTEQLIKDIQENPLQVIVPDVDQILSNQNRINQLAQNIDKNSSQVGSNLIKNLEMPETVGLGQGSKFQLWATARKEAIDENYDTIKAFVKDLKGENISINQSIKNLNGARGQRANQRALSNAAGQQLTTLGKIEELLFKMLSLQSAESGARLEAEMDMVKRAQKASKAKNPMDSFNDEFDATEKYKGPGTANSKAF